jgi:hypothetical protein
MSYFPGGWSVVHYGLLKGRKSEKKERRTCWKIYDGEKATIERLRGVDLYERGVEVVTTYGTV